MIYYYDNHTSIQDGGLNAEYNDNIKSQFCQQKKHLSMFYFLKPKALMISR